MQSYKTMKGGYIQRQSDLALIPLTEKNPDYVQYLIDVGVGAEVLPFDYKAEEIRQAEIKIIVEAEQLYEATIKVKEAEILRRQAIAELEAEK